MKLLQLCRRPVFVTWRISNHGRGTSTCRLLTSSRIPPRLSLQYQPRRSIATNTATLNKTTPQSSLSNEEEPSSLSDQVRFLMRQVPHPVAIITATDPDCPNADEAYRGMTVSSFNTVTLYPEPVISFNVKRPSETLHALQTSGYFHVHLLAPSEETAKLARDFSRGNNNLQISRGEGQFEFSSCSGLNSESTQGPPVLQRKNDNNDNNKNELAPKDLEEEKSLALESAVDFPFIFECRAHPQKIEVYDHTIVLGTVVRTLRHPAAGRRDVNGKIRDGNDPHSTEDLCLTYADTRFWKMGEVI
ncbi:oxidoreductase, putative [Paecilomyces variotii No. 5]|uniref:Oxidoreductase, putative n=1 Tax=Byssochlamys spectabilis (strain No. 5 / NBRC 109023) TaxID=1356009 RepID=V5GA65_BYSSN|nr:oxidoreductase, putative [Paecilomyces variotii No. 5]